MSKLENNTASLEVIMDKVNGVSNEVNSQAAQIAEITALLDGKSVPGGGSGGAVETCSLHLSCNTADLQRIVTTQYINGNIVPYFNGLNVFGNMNRIYDITIDNVICGSTIFINTNGFIVPAYSATGGSEYFAYSPYPNGGWVFKAPTTPNAIGEITLWDDD